MHTKYAEWNNSNDNKCLIVWFFCGFFSFIVKQNEKLFYISLLHNCIQYHLTHLPIRMNVCLCLCEWFMRMQLIGKIIMNGIYFNFGQTFIKPIGYAIVNDSGYASLCYSIWLCGFWSRFIVNIVIIYHYERVTARRKLCM